jgi:glycosyltransferase involved in cell wall biosynthesis
LKRFDKKTAVSKAVKQHYEKHLHLKSVDVFYNAFPLDNFEKYRSDHHKPNERFTILTPGRLVEEKGHRYLFEAIEILNKRGYDFEFLIAGRGPLEEYCLAKTQNAKNIQLIPELTHSKLMKLYNEVDLIVIPSIYEAFGLVVGEAMIMGVPVVATSVYGIIEIIKSGKEGLKVPPGDPSALADAIEKMYLDEPLRRKFVENAQEKIKQFDTKTIILKWKTYYEDLLHG